MALGLYRCTSGRFFLEAAVKSSPTFSLPAPISIAATSALAVMGAAAAPEFAPSPAA